MWKYISAACVGLSAALSGLIWLARTSPAAFLRDADQNLAEWLRRAGGDSPPLHIASGLVDHAGWIIMALIAVGGIAAYIGLRSPLMIRALEVAIDTPSQGSSALWLTVKNRSRTKIEGVQTHLTRVEPEVPAFPVQALPPFELSTKGALEAHRSQTQAPLSVDFVLAAGATDKFEIASLASDGALGWCVTHPAGDATFLLDKTYILTVEVTGGHRTAKARIELALIDNEQGKWTAALLRNNCIARAWQWLQAQQRQAEGQVAWGQVHDEFG